MKLRTRIGLMFATGFAVVALAAATSRYGANLLLDTTHQVRTIHERLEAFDAVRDDLVDIETSARGFVITGEELFLGPYHRAVARLPDHTARLPELVAHDPAQLERVAALLDIGARRRAHADEMIRQRRDVGAEAGRAVVASQRGLTLMKQARGILGDLREAEAARLAELTGRSDRSARRAIELIVGSTGAMALLVLIGTLVLARSITQPIGALAAAANQISQGEWPVIARERSDEIGDLADALSAMARARHEAEDRVRALIDLAPDAFLVADLYGRYTDANVAATELLGYSRDELVGKTVMDLVPAEDVPRLAAVREALLVAGAVDRSEWSLVRKDGTRVPVEVSAKILSDGRWQAFIRDISERKRAQAEREALLEREREHSRRLQAIREAVLAISPLATTSGGKTAEVLRSIVEQARRLTGADFAGLGAGGDRDQACDPWVWSGLSEAETAALGAHPWPGDLLATLSSHVTFPGDGRVAEHVQAPGSPPGRPASEELLTIPIQRNGTTMRKLYLVRRPGTAPFTSDDQAIAELLVVHAAVAIENAKLYDEVRDAVAARENLLAVVSHDLRNPLNAIFLREEVLGSKRAEDRELAEHARWVRRSIGNMHRMIQSLLDAASLDAGHLVIDLQANDFRAVVDEVIDALGPIATEASIALECRMPDSYVARFDRERLAQVVYNLVGNAVKFTPRGGRITITAWASSADLHVTVADTGRGIAPDVLPHVFQRYFTTEHGRRGTGLGLHIARGVVEAHGGRIWVTSLPGEGATFHFTVPSCPASAAAKDRPAPESRERSPTAV